MTQYTRRLTLAVPEAMMPAANNLALVVGESAYDINTFVNANWQDALGNKYAICSTVVKPVVVSMIGKTLNPDNIPVHAEEADIELAQQALDSVVVFEPETEETTATQVGTNHITLAIDYDPLPSLEAMGLIRIEEEIQQ